MSAGKWVRVKLSDIPAEAVGYRQRGHAFTVFSRRSAWPHVCKTCGLVLLRNPLTERAVRLGCYYADHPSWRRAA